MRKEAPPKTAALIFEKTAEGAQRAVDCCHRDAFVAKHYPVADGFVFKLFARHRFLILGMGLFSLGAEISMTPIGAKNRNGADQNQKSALDFVCELCARSCRQGGGAGSADAFQNRSAYRYRGAVGCRRRGRRFVFGGLHASYFHGGKAAVFSACFLRCRFSSCRICGCRFSRHCI